jgi:hypothetical protein
MTTPIIGWRNVNVRNAKRKCSNMGVGLCITAGKDIKARTGCLGTVWYAMDGEQRSRRRVAPVQLDV